MSLRALINTRIAISALLILVVGGVLAIWQVRQAVDREVRSSLNLAVETFRLGREDTNGSLQAKSWKKLLSALQHSRHLQITLTDPFGRTRELLEHEEDKETSGAPSWFGNLVQSDFPEVKYGVLMSDGALGTILISADPSDEIDEAWGESQTLFTSIVLMVIITVISINLVFHNMLRTVRSILSGLRKVATGDYGGKLPAFDIREFNAIAHEINRLTASLAQAQHHNQQLTRHSLQVQERERQLLSRELHDEMGQSLTAIKAMAATMQKPGADIEPTARSIGNICSQLSTTVRHMMRTLHPLSLTELGLGATLMDLVDEWKRRCPSMVTSLHFDARLDEISEETAIHVYRIVQECLTNVVRHAQANKVEIDLSYVDLTAGPLIKLSVRDNGIGGQKEQGGYGLRVMRERVESMQGRFIYEPKTGCGVRVTATLPFIRGTA